MRSTRLLVFAVELDLHIVQNGVVVFVLDSVGGVDAVAGMAAEGVIEGEAVGVGRDVEAQLLRQLFQIERDS
jgi:hypothetical protein